MIFLVIISKTTLMMREIISPRTLELERGPRLKPLSLTSVRLILGHLNCGSSLGNYLKPKGWRKDLVSSRSTDRLIK